MPVPWTEEDMDELHLVRDYNGGGVDAYQDLILYAEFGSQVRNYTLLLELYSETFEEHFNHFVINMTIEVMPCVID